MKRILSACLAVAVLLFAAGAVARAAEKAADKKATPAAAKKAAPAPERKPMTMQGELVDMGCYMDHGAKGAGHKECGTKCIAGGMPMGLLTAEGKLFLLTLNHDNPDPYMKLKTLAGDMVSVTGKVLQGHGMLALDVTAAEAAPPPAPAATE